MIKTATQLKAKVRNLAAEKSVDPQILQRTYVMERLLERVAVSDYRDSLILKGGMLIASMIGLGRRTTIDIDVTLIGETLSVEQVR